MPVVTLYGRPGCPLCAEARVALSELQRRWLFTLEERDIEADDALLRRYMFEVPVVAVDGVEVARAPLSRERLEDALEHALGTP